MHLTLLATPRPATRSAASNRFVLTGALLLLGCISISHPMHAQRGQAQPTQEPAAQEQTAQVSGTVKAEDVVTIALVDDTALYDGNVLISRKGYGARRNLVLLGRSYATSGVLEHAMQQVVVMRRRYGHVPKEPQGAVMHDTSKESADPATRALFQKLLGAPPRQIAGFGAVPAVTIHLTRDVR